MIDILLVEDHPQVRRLLRGLLETYADLRIVGEAQSGEEALSLVATLQPAVVIIDIHLPGLNGIQTTKLIRHECSLIAVIGLTAGEPSDEETALMQAAGGVGLFDKAAVIEALYPAIHEAVKHLQTELSVQRSISG
jgi:DNA-binding NarL/FixJ family response regulator